MRENIREDRLLIMERWDGVSAARIVTRKQFRALRRTLDAGAKVEPVLRP